MLKRFCFHPGKNVLRKGGRDLGMLNVSEHKVSFGPFQSFIIALKLDEGEGGTEFNCNQIGLYFVEAKYSA
jgi:hypothetical protein